MCDRTIKPAHGRFVGQVGAGMESQPRMVAVRRAWLYTLDGDLISRQGPRIVDGAAAVCAVLDEVRRERAVR